MDNLISDLQKKLHEAPELSMREEKTKKIISEFFKANTKCREIKRDSMLLFHREKDFSGNNKKIVIRADMDAIINSNGKAFHGCGHDGHMATLCSLAKMLDSEKIGNDIYFLFQPAEENGLGAKECIPILKELSPDFIFGYHNIPKTALEKSIVSGTILFKEATFACASVGMTFTFTGKQSHAAYPESGINPAYSIAEFLIEARRILSATSGFALITPVHVKIGEDYAFGVSPGLGSVSLTVRAEKATDFELLKKMLVKTAESIAKTSKLNLYYEYHDEFTATVNASEDIAIIKALFDSENISYSDIETPFRWSEDFGKYLEHFRGCFFGVVGDTPPLHSDSYCFDNIVISKAAEAFFAICKNL